MLTVLLIDDDRNMHQYTRTVLETSGHQLFSAYNGNQGLEMIQKIQPDAVLLDYMMPELDGYQVFEELTLNEKYAKYRQIPVIMLTALDERPDTKDKLIKMGLAAYLNKPFGHKELINVIENILFTNKKIIKNNQLHQAIKDAKDFFENIIESSPDAFITTDMNGIITSYSRSAELLFSYSSDDLIGKYLGHFINTRTDFKKFCHEIVYKEIIRDYETDFLSKDQDFIPISFSFTVIKNKENRAIGILAIGKDLSEIKRLEQELIEKERLSALMETAVAINHEINNPLTPILGNIQLLLFRRNEIPDWVVDKLEVIEKNAWRIHHTVQKLNHIKQPVRKQYCGETQMLDIDQSI